MIRRVIVVAAGRGERTGFSENKALKKLNGVSPLKSCVAAFEQTGLFDSCIIVASERDYDLITSEYMSEFVKQTIVGGSTRRESVFNGLKSVSEQTDIVAIHDAARPFVSSDIITATTESAEKYGSGVAATRVVDTIKMYRADGAVLTPERNALRAVQTPQTFNYQLILEAHKKAAADGFDATDDAAIYERYIGGVKLVCAPGGENNVKLTTKRDFIARECAFRIGHGYDAHRLVPGRALTLCGEEIEYHLGLDGHSDADVAIHALIDAMLGAAALGDIGGMFPDSDEKYRGISSLILLWETNAALAERGWRVSNADITIIAQKPKLAGYIDKMRENIARALDLSIEQISVKATTTEKMGFEGRGEGISAHCVAMITGRLT